MSPVLWLQTQASTAMRRRDHKDHFRVLSPSLGLLLAASYNTSKGAEVPGKNTQRQKYAFYSAGSDQHCCRHRVAGTAGQKLTHSHISNMFLF